MNKAKEISALWSQIKPQIGEMVRLCHEVESHAEVTADAYQRGYEEGYKDGYNEPGKGKIQVGDEVVPRETEYDDMIVTRLWKDDYDSDCIDAIGFDGRISSFLVSRVSKTGKHYEIAEVLRKMRENNG